MYVLPVAVTRPRINPYLEERGLFTWGITELQTVETFNKRIDC